MLGTLRGPDENFLEEFSSPSMICQNTGSCVHAHIYDTHAFSEKVTMQMFLLMICEC